MLDEEEHAVAGSESLPGFADYTRFEQPRPLMQVFGNCEN